MEYNISSGAPQLTNSSRTFLILVSLIPVFNFPSEKVPAPPSPNCTFDSVFKLEFFQKLLTSTVLSSMLFPLSIIIGLYPNSDNIREANIPAGPKPTTTGVEPNFLCSGNL